MMLLLCVELVLGVDAAGERYREEIERKCVLIILVEDIPKTSFAHGIAKSAIWLLPRKASTLFQWSPCRTDSNDLRRHEETKPSNFKAVKKQDEDIG